MERSFLSHGVWQACWSEGQLGADDFRSEALDDPQVKAVSERVVVMEDPNYPSTGPSKRPASVTVQTKNGDSFHWDVEGSTGGSDVPLSDEKIQGKFRSLAENVIGLEQADALADRAENLHELSDIGDLTRLLVPPALSR